MDFGLVLQTDPPASQVISLMKRGERNGFRYGWTFDSAVLWQEPFVIYSQILANTQRMRVGPMVTNPGTRTWEVTASTFATLNDMYGNRTVCGIGRGDSAMRVAGRAPNTLARLGEAIDVIRDLAEGREAGRAGNPSTDFVPDEIVDRFCLLGPAEAHIEKLRALQALGVDQFALYDMHDARETTIDAYGADIIPSFR